MTAVVAVVSAPLHPELCRYWSGCEPWGHFGCLKAGAGCLLSVTHMDWGEGEQTCSSMLWISPALALLLSFSCRFLWQTLGSCVLLILSACIPPTSVQTFACKTEFLKKPGILPAVCWLPYSLLFIVQGSLSELGTSAPQVGTSSVPPSLQQRWGTSLTWKPQDLGQKPESKFCSSLCSSSFSLWLWATL